MTFLVDYWKGLTFMIKVRFIGLDGPDSKTFSSFKDLSLWLADKFREANMFLMSLDGNFEILDIFEIVDIEKMDKTNE